MQSTHKIALVYEIIGLKMRGIIGTNCKSDSTLYFLFAAMPSFEQNADVSPFFRPPTNTLYAPFPFAVHVSYE